VFPAKDVSVNIYVGNLAYTATEDDLRGLFEQYGAVDQIRLITDQYTGRAKGFGFVEMADSRAAQSAIAGLNGTDLNGRALAVNEAKPRAPRRESSRDRW
jgi:RNA recognition motif-containing protein